MTPRTKLRLIAAGRVALAVGAAVVVARGAGTEALKQAEILWPD